MQRRDGFDIALQHIERHAPNGVQLRRVKRVEANVGLQDMRRPLRLTAKTSTTAER